MEQFVIFTVKYEKKLLEFAAKATAEELMQVNFSKKVKRDTYALAFSLAKREAFCTSLMDFLMDIAVEENPVYAHSSKLRDMAQDLRNTQIYARELRRLRGFFLGSREVHIDGYVTFRMGEFREKLDHMIYKLVKKIKFGTSPGEC
ncbi:MAG: hypothetical protein FWF79_03480 [Defluviitaleaceae bacterium]|nr:hypothetical protein [Defluviitaleaceae bacterium]